MVVTSIFLTIAIGVLAFAVITRPFYEISDSGNDKVRNDIVPEKLETLINDRKQARVERFAGFCVHCGAPLQKSDQFCPRCGKKLN